MAGGCGECFLIPHVHTPSERMKNRRVNINNRAGGDGEEAGFGGGKG